MGVSGLDFVVMGNVIIHAEKKALLIEDFFLVKGGESSQNPDRSDEPDRLQTIATMAMPRIEAMASDWSANRETVRFFSRSRREKGRHSPRRNRDEKPCGVKRRLNND